MGRETILIEKNGKKDLVAPVKKQTAYVKEIKESGADFSNPEGSTYYEDNANSGGASMLV